MLVAGRVVGWLMIAVALLMASGDAVLALGTSEHPGIMASTLWTLVTGHAPAAIATASIGAMFLAWPAWAAIGPVGVALVVACRPRRRRHRYNRRND